MNAIAPARLTSVLIVFLIASVALSIFAFSRLDHAKADAQQRAEDLTLIRSELNDLSDWHMARPPRGPVPTADNAPFSAHLRSAAEVADIADQIASIEPGQPVRVHDTDFTQTPIYVRLNRVTLRQLITFLHQLSSSDRSMTSKMIELSVPDALPLSQLPPSQGLPSQSPASQAKDAKAEMWTADITLNNLAFSPRPRESR